MAEGMAARPQGMAVIADRIALGGRHRWALSLGLVAAGIVALVVAAKLRVPFWPVPMTMQTFAVLMIGAAYGPRLGGATVLGYLLIGALGADVFTGEASGGLAYMLGSTGGYLLGFLLAALALGALARRGWDRSIGWTALALLIGNALIYAPGLLWLGALHGFDKPILDWGLWPFLLGDALKLALAAMLLPLAWRALGTGRG